MALDRKATKKTDDEFYANHPEMVDANGKRKPIDPKNPAHQEYKEEWKQNYQKNKAPVKTSASKSKKAGDSKEPCPANQKPCCFRKVTISCSHTKKSEEVGLSCRKYKLSLPLAPNSTKPSELHVLAGEKHGDKITVSLDAGSCHMGHEKWPNLVAQSDSEYLIGQKELTIEARSKHISFLENWKDYLWPLSESPREYYVYPNACEGAAGAAAIIKVFPNIKWEVEAMFSFGGKTKTDSLDEGNWSRTRKQSAGSLSLPSIKFTYDKKTEEIAPQFEKYAKHTLKLLNAVKEFSDTFGPLLTEIGNVEITVEYPNIGLNYTYQTVELEDDYGLDYSYAVTFKADPLIKVKGKTDILDWVLTAATGPLKVILLKIKKRLAKGLGKEGKVQVKAKLAIEFRVDAGISGELKWEKRKGQAVKDASKEGSIDMSIPITIEGIGGADLDVFMFSAGAGVKAGAKTAFGAKLYAGQDEDGHHGIYAQGQLRWEGIKLYYCAYASGGLKTAEHPEDETPFPDGDSLKTQSGSVGSIEGKHESKEECELAKPRFWPDEPGKHYLLGEP